MPRGLLFDFDGTLYGDWRVWIAVIQDTLHDFKLNTTAYEALEKARSMIKDHTFVNISGVVIAMAKERGVSSGQEVRARFLERLDKVMDETGPGADLIVLLDRFKKDGFRMGLVTFMRRFRLVRRLNLWKLTSYFSSIITPEQLSEFKPSPRPFVLAMQDLKLAPADCFVIGDEPVDMAGGKKAGAITIGVPKGFYSEDELKQAGADYIISSLNLLPEIVQP